MPASWWTGLHDAAIRIPLAARMPGGRGVCTGLAQHIDLFATLLEMAGVQPRVAQNGRSLPGVLNHAGPAEDLLLRDAVYTDSGTVPGIDRHGADRTVVRTMTPEHAYYPSQLLFAEHPGANTRSRAVRTDRWKYVGRLDDVEELYDLAADPDETDNLLVTRPGEHGDIRDEMRERLLRWTAETGDVLFGDNRAASPSPRGGRRAIR